MSRRSTTCCRATSAPGRKASAGASARSWPASSKAVRPTCWRTRAFGCMSSRRGGAAGCWRVKAGCAPRSATLVHTRRMPCHARCWAASWNGSCSPTRATGCRSSSTTSGPVRSICRAPTCGARCWRAAPSRSGCRPSTTCPARRAAPTGMAASPTTTCIWTTARCRPRGRRWCSTRISSARSCQAGWTRRSSTGIVRRPSSTTWCCFARRPRGSPACLARSCPTATTSWRWTPKNAAAAGVPR
mmetsp:Transcript_37514/g.87443  ORF Transcript_37514/g.87443 Transcript_37514/m.87443 type:complete len:244 (-) Transcript_37514:8531-9262(-)